MDRHKIYLGIGILLVIGLLLFIILNFSTKTYKIIDNGSNDASSYYERGFYLEKGKNDTVIAITIGERPNGGYGIDIKNVIIDSDKVEIDFTEKKPKEDEVTTQEITYPYVKIKFNFSPKSITVKDLDTNEELRRIK